MKWLLILPVFVLSGCISGNMRVDPDGTCHAEFTSMLKSVEAISFCGLDAINSTNNDAAIKKLLDAIK